MKTVIKILGFALIGFIFGYIGAAHELWLPEILSFITNYTTAIIITLLIIIGSILVYGFLYTYLSLKKLSGQTTEELTDEQDRNRYIALADASLISNIAFYLSIFYIAYTVVIQDNFLFICLSLVALILSYVLLIHSYEIGRTVYKERNLPGLGSNKMEQKLLDVMDDGEKHIAFLGLSKVYNFLLSGLLFGIIICIGYSYVSDESQMFSIIVMCLLAAIAQIIYSVSIRKYA